MNCPGCGAHRTRSIAIQSIAAVLHAQTPRRQDSHIAQRARGRAQAGDRALRRREGLAGAGRAARSGGMAQAPRRLFADPQRRRARLRGTVTTTPATASRPSSVRRSRTRITPSAPVTRPCTCATRCGATPTSCGAPTAVRGRDRGGVRDRALCEIGKGWERLWTRGTSGGGDHRLPSRSEETTWTPASRVPKGSLSARPTCPHWSGTCHRSMRPAHQKNAPAFQACPL